MDNSESESDCVLEPFCCCVASDGTPGMSAPPAALSVAEGQSTIESGASDVGFTIRTCTPPLLDAAEAAGPGRLPPGSFSSDC